MAEIDVVHVHVHWTEKFISLNHYTSSHILNWKIEISSKPLTRNVQILAVTVSPLSLHLRNGFLKFQPPDDSFFFISDQVQLLVGVVHKVLSKKKRLSLGFLNLLGLSFNIKQWYVRRIQKAYPFHWHCKNALDRLDSN